MFYEDNLNSNSDDSFLKEYQETKAELETMYNHITEGIINGHDATGMN